jgi:hypothetical protein
MFRQWVLNRGYNKKSVNWVERAVILDADSSFPATGRDCSQKEISTRPDGESMLTTEAMGTFIAPCAYAAGHVSSRPF